MSEELPQWAQDIVEDYTEADINELCDAFEAESFRHLVEEIATETDILNWIDRNWESDDLYDTDNDWDI